MRVHPLRLALFALAAPVLLGSASARQCPPGSYPPAPPPPAPVPPADPDPGAATPYPTEPGAPGANPGPATPGPSQPGTPGGGGSGGPSTPGPAAPGTPASAPPPLGIGPRTPATPPGLDLGLDELAWERWWSFNRDPFLDFESVLERLHPETGNPGEARVDPLSARRAGLTYGALYGEVVPELLAIVASEENARLVRNAMLALGRIGDRPEGHEPPAPFAPAIARHLAHSNRAVGETAIIALGVLGSLEAARNLAELAGDTDVGRALCRRSKVPSRYRAVAAYGLGLVGDQTTRPEVARFAVHHLVEVLAADAKQHADLQAACVIALGLARLPESGHAADDARASVSLEGQIGHLLGVLGDKRASDEARAFAPTSLARLLRGTGDRDLKERVARELIERAGKSTEKDDHVRRSAIVALGRIGDADADPVDADIRAALEAAVRANDSVGRNFAVVALASAGGNPGSGEGDPLEAAEATANFLEGTLARGKSGLRAWTGLALGVLGSGLRAEGRLLARGAADALLHKMGETHAAGDAAAYALGVGLIGDNRARAAVLQRIEKVHDDEHRAALAVALGLMGDLGARPVLLAMMDDAHYKPQLMEQAAIARALLGDADLVGELVERLDTCDCWPSYFGVCRALAWTGDARALPKLLALVRDDDVGALEKSLVVEALGWIGDRSKLSWRSRVSVGLNYVAVPPTLTDPTGFGVLDTL